jgi:LysM repeat protein
MKQFTVLLFMAFAIILFQTGCQTKLAESPYGNKEQSWEEFIKTTYPDWDPPQTVPPTNEDAIPRGAVDIEEENPIIVPDNVQETVEIQKVIVEDNDSFPETIKEMQSNSTTAEFQTYKIQKGDTLWSIAKEFYGTGKEWRKIYEANKDSISAPGKIKTGMEIRIPAAQ